MAQAKKKAQKAQKAANPYVKRIVEDEDLRQNIADAYESARKAYALRNRPDDLTSAGSLAQAIASNR